MVFMRMAGMAVIVPMTVGVPVIVRAGIGRAIQTRHFCMAMGVIMIVVMIMGLYA
jgi:thiazole synthase ThiGH ThiG subunit